MEPDALLEPAELKRYADAIVKGGLSLRPGDTLVIRCEHAHRDLMVAVAEAAYRAGAEAVEALVTRPADGRARAEVRTRRRARRDHAVVGAPSARDDDAHRARSSRSPASPIRTISTGSPRRGSAPTSCARRCTVARTSAPRSRCAPAGRSPAGRPTTGRASSTPSCRRSTRSGGSRATCSGSAGSPTRTAAAPPAG